MVHHVDHPTQDHLDGLPRGVTLFEILHGHGLVPKQGIIRGQERGEIGINGMKEVPANSAQLARNALPQTIMRLLWKEAGEAGGVVRDGEAKAVETVGNVCKLFFDNILKI